MGDDPQMTGPNASLGAVATAFVGTVWGKVVAILAAISLVIGIALEVQSFVTGYYVLQKTASEAYVKCRTGGGCPGVGSGLYDGLPPEKKAQADAMVRQHDADQKRKADLIAAAREMVKAYPIVTAPDGRRIYEYGVSTGTWKNIDEAKPEDFIMLKTPLGTDAGDHIYEGAPERWVDAPPSPKE